MPHDAQTIKTTVKDYIMSEFLPGEDPSDLTDTTPLLTSGILDSISTFKLVGFLEITFGVRMKANDIANHLNTIDEIAGIVQARQGAA